MSPIASFEVVLSLSLNALVLFWIYRSGVREFLPEFTFCAAQIAVILFTNSLRFLGAQPAEYVRIYWYTDFVVHACLAAVIVSLIRRSVSDPHQRRVYTWSAAATLVLLAVYSAIMLQDPNFNRWMGSISRNLSFGEEMLNFVLWYLILDLKIADPVVQWLSTGIGVQVTGEVIGHTFRLYAGRRNVWVPTTLVYISEVLCLAIWAWAFASLAPRNRRT